MKRSLQTRTCLGALTVAGWLQLASGEAAGVQQAGAPGELSEREAAVHVLNRLGYGPRPGDVERVLAVGLDAYVEAQLYPTRRPPDADLEKRLARLDATDASAPELMRRYPPPQEMRREMRRRGEDVDTATLRRAARESFTPVLQLSQARLTRAVYSENQLQEVLVDFWINHFNVFARKGPIRYYLADYENAIRSHSLGDFRELLGVVAHSPAMLFYLDNWLSGAEEGAPRAGDAPHRSRGAARRGGPGPRRSEGLNENYARELLELHTLGVDGGYTQDDVVEVARAFTGWTIDLRTGKFAFRSDLNDAGSKVVLGHAIAGGGGKKDGEQILDLLARHPSTARFISHKLAVRFVSDDPPAALVERAAVTFTRTDGDIREVVRTIITSPEFMGREAYRTKLKTPLEWIVSTVRAMDAPLDDMRPLLGALRNLEMPLYMYQPPTGYPDVAEAWASSSAVLKRAELAQRIGHVAMRGPARRDVASLHDAERVVDVLLGRLLPAGDHDRLRTIIEDQAEASTDSRAMMSTTVALTLASPEFQRK